MLVECVADGSLHRLCRDGIHVTSSHLYQHCCDQGLDRVNESSIARKMTRWLFQIESRGEIKVVKGLAGIRL